MVAPDTWTSGDWFEAIVEPYVVLLGEPMLGTILGGALILAYWIHAGDVVLPTIIVLLLGGVLTAVLPGDVVGIARGMIVIGMTVAILAAAQRYAL